MKKVRVSTLREKKKSGEKIVTVTAHDALSAAIAERAGVDLILVGDSLGMTSLGFPTTIPVTMDMMVHHAAAVARGASLPLLIGDMPFMTYKISLDQTLANAGRFIQEGGMEGVKIEGGAEMASVIERIVQAGIPVMAHIGILPQSVHAQVGFKVQGRGEAEAERLLNDARALEQAGAFSLVLECMPPGIAAKISQAIAIPTIGIGAGADCDGQVLVFSDLLGMSDKKPPKFARSYANLYETSVKAIESYAADVRAKKFPGP
ncbi:3-methyl-2-oxobutanoate hydroxymethyltransferase, partial [Candidatus Sumerlaeota bacterium]|nr:3-methyl-2-oxobutanoate hydroxymethyltransferase [Candidatus Sumerlaeota bacterium]